MFFAHPGQQGDEEVYRIATCIRSLILRFWNQNNQVDALRKETNVQIRQPPFGLGTALRITSRTLAFKKSQWKTPIEIFQTCAVSTCVNLATKCSSVYILYLRNPHPLNFAWWGLVPFEHAIQFPMPKPHAETCPTSTTTLSLKKSLVEIFLCQLNLLFSEHTTNSPLLFGRGAANCSNLSGRGSLGDIRSEVRSSCAERQRNEKDKWQDIMRAIREIPCTSSSKTWGRFTTVNKGQSRTEPLWKTRSSNTFEDQVTIVKGSKTRWHAYTV